MWESYMLSLPALIIPNFSDQTNSTWTESWRFFIKPNISNEAASKRRRNSQLEIANQRGENIQNNSLQQLVLAIRECKCKWSTERDKDKTYPQLQKR